MTKITRFRDIPQFIFCNYQVNQTWTHLEECLKGYAEMGLNLEPDFQRGHVWSDEKRIAYIEFILRGGMGAKDIYFNCVGWESGNYTGPFELVDGKQRLTAVLKFLHNELPVFGSYFKEFTDEVRMVRTDFIFHINSLDTRKEVLQWYLDLNSGGVVHTSEELLKVKELLSKEK